MKHMLIHMCFIYKSYKYIYIYMKHTAKHKKYICFAHVKTNVMHIYLHICLNRSHILKHLENTNKHNWFHN